LPVKKPAEDEAAKSAVGKKSVVKKPEIVLHRMDYEPQNPNNHFIKVIEPIVNKWFNIRDFIRVILL
jgi:hypothetical protein